MAIRVSEEQAAIIAAINTGFNVIVEAVAGSGKTTLVLEAAKTMPSSTFIQITYNSALKSDVRLKVEQQNIKNLEVHSYHSLARYYNKKAFTDEHIKQVVVNDSPLLKRIRCTILVVDEAQDMTLEYYRLLKKFIRDSRGNLSLVIMGDRHQAINAYRGSDYRYLTLANKIFESSREWQVLTLTMSYRMTRQIATFVTTLTEKEIRTCKEGPLVTYLCLPDYGNNSKLINHLCEFIVNIIESGEYIDDDIFVLTPTLKKSGGGNLKVCHWLENKLKLQQLSNGRYIRCYSPDKEENYNKRAAAGKIVFSTLQGSKGRERKCVILLNFDASYFDYFAKDKLMPTSVCPNIHYVATTRASHHLFVVHSTWESKPANAIQYINKPMIENLIQNDTIEVMIDNIDSLNFTERDRIEAQFTNICVTEMVTHIKHEYLTLLIDICKYIELNGATNNMILPATAQFSEYAEELSSVLGVVMPMSWEFLTFEESTVMTSLNYKKYQDFIIKASPSRKGEKFELLSSSSTYLQDVAKYAIDYVSVRGGFAFKITQILNLEWFTQNIHDHCLGLFKEHVNINGPHVFEDCYKVNLMWMNKEFNISGSIDYKCDNTVWEFKCVSELEMEHLLQLAIYAFLIEVCGARKDDENTVNFNNIKQEPARNKYKLFNCKNGMIWELMYDDIDIKELINVILISKQTNMVSDEEFIINCLKIRDDEILRDIPRQPECIEASVVLRNIPRQPECTDASVVFEPIVGILPPNLYNLTLKQLKQYCKANGITRYSEFNKAELIEYITSYHMD